MAARSSSVLAKRDAAAAFFQALHAKGVDAIAVTASIVVSDGRDTAGT
jgi:hypothetical protein